MIYYAHIPSPIGTLTAVCQDGCLTAVHLLPGELPKCAIENNQETVLAKTTEWLHRYFAGEAPVLDIPMKPRGTVFQQSVWNLLKEIPYDKTVTYGSIAARLGNPNMSAQAVGQAVGKNPIAILIPCHRVLGAGSRLTGYAGGLENKRFLLDLEKIEYK